MKLIKMAFILIAATMLFNGCSNKNDKPVAKLLKISGTVEIRTAPDTKFESANPDYELYNDMAVRTGENSNAELSFTCGGMLKLSSGAFFQVKSGQILGKQTSGAGLYEIDKQPQPISIETPHGVTTILGTKFRQVVNADSVEIVLTEGQIEFYDNAGNKAKVEAGHKLLVKKDQPLSDPVSIDDFNVDELFNEGKSLKNF